MLDDEHKSNFFNASGKPPSRRHLAPIAASIAAHAAIVALLVIFAAPVARRHSEWVLAYLVEGANGGSGRDGADAAASGPAARHAASVARFAPPKAARKPRRRVADAPPALASIAPSARSRPRDRPYRRLKTRPRRMATRPPPPRLPPLPFRAAAGIVVRRGLSAPPMAAPATTPIRPPMPTTPVIRHPFILRRRAAASSKAP